MKKIKLGDIGKVSMCKRILKSQTSPEEEIPFYKISTFGGQADCFISRKIFEEYKSKYSYPKVGDILISAAGTIGKTVIYDGSEAFYQDSNIVWIDNDESQIINDYLYYFYQLEHWKKTTGSTIARLYNDNLRDIEISFPEGIAKQRQIVSILKLLDRKILVNKKINATLEAMAKTLYDYWFVQFDFPDENGKPYKTSGGKMIYNAELGREVPAGWKVKGLAQIANIVQGNSPNGTTLNETGKGMIFFQGKTDFGFRFPEVRIYTTAPYRLAEKFDTLLSVRAPVGAVNMAHEKCCIGRGLAAIKSDYPSFIYYTMIRLQTYLEKLSGIGTTFDSITKDDIMALKICIPPKNYIKMFDTVVSKYDNEILLKTDENDCLAALRDWLLPMLMNGQVRFKEN